MTNGELLETHYRNQGNEGWKFSSVDVTTFSVCPHETSKGHCTSYLLADQWSLITFCKMLQIPAPFGKRF